MGKSSTPSRNLYDEISGELKAKLEMTPDMYNAESQYRPQYAGLDVAGIESLLMGTPAGTKQVSGMRSQYVPESVTPWQTGMAVPEGARVERSGGKWGGQDMLVMPAHTIQVPFQEEQPYDAQKGIFDVLNSTADPMRQAWQKGSPETAGLLASLNQQAQAGLDAGASLDPAMAREVQQATRMAQSARGLGYGRSDATQEAMMSGYAGDAMRQQRQQFAGTVANMNQTLQPNAMDTLLKAYGIQRQAGPNLFGSTIDANDLFSTNYNAEVSNVNAKNNATAGYASAGIGAAASIVAAAL
jgi:hypothetical protein